MNYLLESINEEISMINSLEFNILMILGIISTAVILLRVLLTFFYSGQKGLFKLNSKEVKSKDDLKNIKYSLLNKIVKDFQRTGEKGIANIDVENLVKRHVNSLNFIGIGFMAMEKLIMDFELGIIAAGLIFAVIFDSSYLFGLFSIAAFVLFRLISLLFDFKSSRKKLIFDIQNYVEREVGQFYIGDISTLIQQLKLELTAALGNQANVLSLAVENMALKLTDRFSLILQDAKETFTASMSEFLKFSEKLDEPFEKWKEAVEHAFDAQNQMNTAAYALGSVIKDFGDASASLEKGIMEYSRLSSEQTKGLNSGSKAIQDAAQSLLNQYDHIKTMNEAIKGQINYMEGNQQLLERTVQEYEHSLKLFTQDAAQAFVSITEYGMKDTYEAINAQFREHMRQISVKNLEAAEKMEDIFKDMAEKSRVEMQAVVNLKEQMDLYFNELNRRD